MNTFIFFIIFVMPKILLSIFIGILMLFLSMDVFICSMPEKALDLLCAFMDLVVFVMSMGTCSSLEEFNAKQKKEGMEEIDPFDFF